MAKGSLVRGPFCLPKPKGGADGIRTRDAFHGKEPLYRTELQPHQPPTVPPLAGTLGYGVPIFVNSSLTR